MASRLQPLVSIILPAYNCADYINETLSCLFQQSYKPIEIIVVNDGSKDSTLEILKAFANDNQIILIDQKNKGVAAARNAGIEKAQGDYIAFIDSDDYWFPEKISTQAFYLEQHPELGAVYSNWHEWHPDHRGVFPSPLSMSPKEITFDIDDKSSGWLYNQLLSDCIIHTSSVMVRRFVLRQIGGFDTNLTIGEDYDLWLRLSRVTRINKLSTPLSLYKIHTESLTKKKPLNYCFGALVIERAISKWGYIGPDGAKAPKMKIWVSLGNIYFNFIYQHYKTGNLKIAVVTAIKKITLYPYFCYRLAKSMQSYFIPHK